MTGLRLDAYILSKIIALGLLCAVQAVLIVTTFAVFIGLPLEGVFWRPYIELLITVFLTSLSAASMGVLVSSLSKNADRAMTTAPLLLMPQILFSGLIFTLSGAAETLSWVTVCRWSMEGFRTTANLNDLLLKLQEQGLNIIHESEKFYDFTSNHLLSSWGILIVFVIIFSAASGFVLKKIKKNQ
jgi:ABC-type transport system involved in multi-copper enzyme maturation permease subunit